ncbi:MAG: hypothetical protein LBJ26_06225 [Paenibacillus sp.]|jgi:hypothetical protein|nr:hypothetical protein [Paenibacillus sp.]
MGGIYALINYYDEIHGYILLNSIDRIDHTLYSTEDGGKVWKQASLVGSGGNIELCIGGKKHALAIQSSRVSHFELKNGNNFLTGSFETGIKRDNGKLYPSTVSFASIIETGESSFYVPMGVVLAFGNDSFGTQEIYDIVRKQAN